MAKTQMLKMVIPYDGTYRVHYDSEAKVNPWSITKYVGRHTHVIQRYGDYHSCMCDLKHFVWNHNVERM